MKDLNLMIDMARSVINNSNGIPVTVKMRAGWDNTSIISTEAAVRLEKVGVKAITLHPRTTKPGSSTHRRRYVAAHSKTRARGGHPCQRRFSRKVFCRRCTILVHGDGTLDDLGSTKLQKQWRSRPKTTGVTASRLTLLDINRLQLLSRLKCRLHGS